MSPLVIGLRFLLFRVHIFADTKRGSGIRNSPSRLIADYFQFWKFQQAHMGGLRLRIDQLGCGGEAVLLPSADWSSCSVLSQRVATLRPAPNCARSFYS